MLTIKNLLETNLFSFISFALVLFFFLSKINLTIERSLLFIIIIILVSLYVYNTKISQEEQANKSRYNELSENIDPSFKYLYSNYIIAYIFYSLLPYKIYNPLAYNDAVKKTNKLLKYKDICISNIFFIQRKNVLDIIYQLKMDILNNLTSIIVNMPDNLPLKASSEKQQLMINRILKSTVNEQQNINSKIYAAEPVLKRLIFYLNILFHNMINKIKKRMNNDWDSGNINIYSYHEDLNEGASPSPLNLRDYNPHYSIY